MRLLLLAVLLVLPAFFAAAEVALLRLRPSRVEVLVEEEQAGARSIQRLQRRLRRALLVSQLGATLALVALGWAGRGLGGRLWSDGSVGVAWRDTALFLSIVLLATLVAGLLPKAWVLNRPESSALRLVPLLEVVMRCLAPLLNLLEALGSNIADIVQEEFGVSWLYLELGKPGAVTGSRDVGVIIERGSKTDGNNH